MIRRFVTKASRRRLHGSRRLSGEVPQARGLPLVGTTLALLAAGSAPKLHLYIDKRHRQLGPVFRDKIGPISAIFVSDPEEMRSVFAQEGRHPAHMLPEAWVLYNRAFGRSRGLFFMDGEEWLHFRKIMNKLLLRGDPRAVEEACITASEQLVERVRALGPRIDDLEKELYRWSLNVITAVLMGAKNYDASRGRLEEVLGRLAGTVSSVFESSVKLQLMPAVVAAKLRLPAWRRFASSVSEALSASTLLVTTLLELPASDGILQRMVEEKLQREEIVKLVADLIIAAGDTTAYTMEWLLYLVAKNRRVQQELRLVLKEEPAPALLKNCVRETLRLYPVAPFITRYLPADSTISGYHIPKGSLVIMSLYTMSRDGRYFENPEVFKPDRWLRSGYGSVAAMQQASLPFAMGARSCIGRRIAEAQLQLALAGLVRAFDVELVGGREPEMVLRMVAVPSEPVGFRFTRIS